jgi:hypothetical protein
MEKWNEMLPIAITGAVLLATSAFAQQPRTRGPDPEARVPGHTVVGPPQARDPRTTTGQAPIAVPGEGNPYGAGGGPTGRPNPDRVPAGTPSGQSEPPGD